MATLIGLAALAAVVVWLVLPRRRLAGPEDDLTTPVDEAELAAAERELEADPRPRALEEGWDEDEDDWGPGAA